jgi:hypothetical protein
MQKMLNVRKISSVLFAGAVLAATLRPGVIEEGTELRYISIIETTRLFAPTLGVFSLLGLALVLIFSSSKIRTNLTSAGMLLFFFSLYYISRQIYEFGMDARLALAYATTAIHFLIFAIVLPTTSGLMDWRDMCIKSMFWAGIVYLTLNSLQYFFDPIGVTWNGRVFGLANHPNFLAIFCAHMAIISTDVVINKERIRFERLLGVFGIAAAIIFIVLSGSRSGLLALSVGAAIMAIVRIRSTRQAMIAVTIFFITIASLVMLINVADESVRYDRFVSSDDTRTELWKRMWESFLAQPVFGAGLNGGTASSYLRVLADTGIVGGIIFFAMLAPLVKRIFLVSINRNAVPHVTIPLAATTLAGGLTEGYFLDFSSFSLLAVYVMVYSLGRRFQKTNPKNDVRNKHGYLISRN